MLHEAIEGSQVKSLSRGVYPFEGRTYGYHVHIRILLGEKSAFQTCVDGAHLRALAEKLAVGCDAGVPERGFHCRSPARVLPFVLHIGTGHNEIGLYLHSSSPSGRRVAASLAGSESYHSLFGHLYGSQVGGSLHEARYLLAHGKHAVRAGDYGVHQSARRSGIDGERIVGAVLYGVIYLYVLLYIAEFLHYVGFEGDELVGEGGEAALRKGYDCPGFPGYGIALVAAVYGQQLVGQRTQPVEHAAQKHHCRCASAVDVVAAVTAHAGVHGHLYSKSALLDGSL